MLRFVLGTALAAALLLAVPAGASAPPVGPLPPGPVTTIETTQGSLVAIALPHDPKGWAWRRAGGFGGRVLREEGEATVGADAVVVFRAVRFGRVVLRYGLTRGESTGARASRTYRVTVSGPSRGFSALGGRVRCAVRLPGAAGLHCASPGVKARQVDGRGVVRLRAGGPATAVRPGSDLLLAIDGDRDFTPRPALAPGRTWRVDGYACSSRGGAVTCRSGGRGFTISPQGWRALSRRG